MRSERAELALTAVEPVRVVVVDDTPSLRMLTRIALEGSGFEVVGEAGDGQAGIEAVATLRPDLVLLDLAMPVMDGLEALPLMREALPGVTVVIVSGFERKAMEGQVLEAGADGYLQKGTPPDQVLDALYRLFPQQSGLSTKRPAHLPEPHLPEPRLPDDQLQVLEEARCKVLEEARYKVLEEDMEQLLYVVSHDLSEPVHVIKGFAQRLARRSHSDDEGEFCEFIIDAADRMQQLLDDLLDYARSGRADLPQELLDCHRLIDSVLAGLGSAIAASGGRVTVGDLPRELVGSRLVLTQVLHNLVTNALKFVDSGTVPLVRIEVQSTAAGVTVRVTDNGLGIEEGQEERIFEPFKRLHSRSAYPGSGIGLAICRRLVQRQGGHLRLERQEHGSTFVMELPA